MEVTKPKVQRLQVPESEACEVLGGVCRRTMHNWRKAGLIAFVRCGDRIFYRMDELERFSKANEVAAQAEG